MGVKMIRIFFIIKNALQIFYVRFNIFFKGREREKNWKAQNYITP